MPLSRAVSPICGCWPTSSRRSGYVHGPQPTSIDAGIYGFIANIYFYTIDTPLKQFVVAHDNIVRHCQAMHGLVMRLDAPNESSDRYPGCG